jgi:DNA-binding protein HU-beta
LYVAPKGQAPHSACLFFRLDSALRALFNHPLRMKVKAPGITDGEIVNKSELVEQIAKSADISKASATRALDAVLEAVTTSLRKDESVTLVGFGTFSVSTRAERTGRNPRTKEAIQIASAKVPKFKAGKALKDALN